MKLNTKIRSITYSRRTTPGPNAKIKNTKKCIWKFGDIGCCDATGTGRKSAKIYKIGVFDDIDKLSDNGLKMWAPHVRS